MAARKYRYFVGDFETTVYKGQTNTEVWASASVEMYTEDVLIFHSIGEQFEYFVGLNSDIICYYHNLKFDGSFWLSYLMIDLGLEQACNKGEKDINDFSFMSPKEMPNNTFTYSISNMGQWYKLIIKVNGKIIEFRDSLKLLPFSVNKLGEGFKTKHRKLEMEYTGFRYPGCEITDEEKKYIANDVLVVKEALEITFNQGHKRLTIGSCCLEEYRKSIGKKTYDKLFPNLYDISIDNETYGSKTAGDYIKKSYRGGWCYVVQGKEKQIKKNGITADVNSLYPSMMSSESGNKYPVGEPTFWKGNTIPEKAMYKSNYFFIRICTRFYIKNNFLPFIQVKNNLMYKATEMLKTSDVFNSSDGNYYPEYVGLDGTVKQAKLTLTLTMTDFKLLLDHYNLVDFEILDGCYFRSAIGIFDNYIEKYKKIKVNSKGAERQLAKLFLNNLYGKMASSTNSSFKVAYLKEDKSVGFYTVLANDKQPGYIPVGSAITSYARNFTIRAAQQNYYGENERGFIYADTDSIHCDLTAQELKGITVHPSNFCCWDLESYWDTGFFVRQKTYIEHVTHEQGEEVKPYYNVKCAGMPDKCKNLFIKSMEHFSDKPENELTEDEKAFKNSLSEDEKLFISENREITDFDVGLVVPGKLLPKRILGGVLLVDTCYEMR